MNRRRGGVVIATIVIAALVPAVGRATDITSAQLHALAAGAANGNSTALARLRAVTAVDGRQAPLGDLLGQATPEAQLRARLGALAAASAAARQQMSAEAARAAAATILDQPRYGKPTVGDPLSNALSWVGRKLASLERDSPGGPLAFWVLAGLIVLTLAAIGTRRMLRRLAPDSAVLARNAATAGEDPVALAREAEAAETRGAFGDAIRLRFRAGLLTLSDRRAIQYRPSLLTADVARRLRSPQFDSLATTFERVAYGGVPARREDSDAAREGWRSVLSEAGPCG
jgi:hypothetical protein